MAEIASSAARCSWLLGSGADGTGGARSVDRMQSPHSSRCASKDASYAGPQVRVGTTMPVPACQRGGVRTRLSQRLDLKQAVREKHDELLAAPRRVSGLIGCGVAPGYTTARPKHGPLEVNFRNPGITGRQVHERLGHHGLAASLDRPGDTAMHAAGDDVDKSGVVALLDAIRDLSTAGDTNHA